MIRTLNRYQLNQLNRKKKDGNESLNQKKEMKSSKAKGEKDG
jgi:hypothetical protein